MARATLWTSGFTLLFANTACTSLRFTSLHFLRLQPPRRATACVAGRRHFARARARTHEHAHTRAACDGPRDAVDGGLSSSYLVVSGFTIQVVSTAWSLRVARQLQMSATSDIDAADVAASGEGTMTVEGAVTCAMPLALPAAARHAARARDALWPQVRGAASACAAARGPTRVRMRLGARRNDADSAAAAEDVGATWVEGGMG